MVLQDFVFIFGNVCLFPLSLPLSLRLSLVGLISLGHFNHTDTSIWVLALCGLSS